MSFSVIYYVCIACPTVERTLEMVDRYVAHGAKAFQIDMPSKDPASGKSAGAIRSWNCMSWSTTTLWTLLAWKSSSRSAKRSVCAAS